MFRNFLPLVLLGCLPCAMHSQTTDPKARLEQLRMSTALDREGMHPWHLRMSFDLFDIQGKKQESGTIEEWWMSQKMKKTVITSPSLNVTLPLTRDQEKGLNQRTLYLVRQLMGRTIHPVPDFMSFNLGSVKAEDMFEISEVPRKIHDVPLDCLNVWNKISVRKFLAASFCMEPQKELLRLQTDGAGETVRNNPGRFLNTEVALDHSLAYADRVAIKGHIDSLKTWDPKAEPVDMSDAVQEIGSQPNGIAVGRRVPTTVAPRSPKAIAEGHISGTVILYGTVTSKGDVVDVGTIASPSEILIGPATEAVKLWKYEPLLRDGKPIAFTTTFIFHFGQSSQRQN